jgi:hypothetical protein
MGLNGLGNGGCFSLGVKHEYAEGCKQHGGYKNGAQKGYVAFVHAATDVKAAAGSFKTTV